MHPRKLGVPGEDMLTGQGVRKLLRHLRRLLFRGKDIVVIGGGDSALEEGIFLTRFANKVEIIHRRDELRGGATLQKRAFNNDKISFIWDTVVTEIRGDGMVNEVVLENVKTEQTVHPTEGFYLHWHYPNSNFLVDQLEMDEEGYVLTDELMRTSVPGVLLPAKFRIRFIARSQHQSARARQRRCRQKMVIGTRK